MPVPAEYERASAKFCDYLVDARDTADLWSTHVTYTMTQGVFQVFRRRLSTQDSIAFANILPICLRALFVTDWNIDEEMRSFESREVMTREVKLLRENHNFSTETAISDVAKALRRHVDEKAFDKLLTQLPEGAVEFWTP
ncbi:DUF2267 domain-containing protein [uncultured Paraglaciecola sp.]|uniref:DUF2267 domain-containing protein n=1 Tax=uncultured Paraglaciecola sp. TaxID=1765024 RepID=UPI0030D9F288|tara:strand:- start:584319 stop:584738 length:420 start_codon:yes stop_codon:yes gene_type:complete